MEKKRNWVESGNLAKPIQSKRMPRGINIQEVAKYVNEKMDEVLKKTKRAFRH